MSDPFDQDPRADFNRYHSRPYYAPNPPSEKQEWFLRQRGLWRSDMTGHEAWELIGQIKKQEAENGPFKLPPPRKPVMPTASGVQQSGSSDRVPGPTERVAELAQQVAALSQHEMIEFIAALLRVKSETR